MKRLLLISLAAFIASGINVVAQTHYLNIEPLKKAKASGSVQRYVKAGDSAIETGCIVVTDKTGKHVPDPHYYASLSRYYWPDPENPDGPYVNRDGQTNPEIRNYDRDKLSILANNCRSLAQAFYVTGDNKYFDAFEKQIRAWFIDKKTYMYPNMTYAQFVPGMYDGQGRCFGIIDAYSFNEVLESVLLVDSERKLKKSTMKALKSWCSEFKDWLLTSQQGIDESNTGNNHSLAYDVTLTCFALFCGDMETVKAVREAFPARRLDAQIMPDGSMPRELARTKAMDYCLFNLQHLIDYCYIQQSIGEQFYAQNRSKIDSAFDFLMPFVNHEQEWPYKDIAHSFNNCSRKLIQEQKRLNRLLED